MPTEIKDSKKNIRLSRMSYAVSVAFASILASHIAIAQEAKLAATESGAANTQEPQSIVVVGTRKSLASAMERKKRAGTITDSIVAEDINQFPDKNVGEALSRVTGVQLSRDFGEGTQVSIRGVEPNLNRVEINGMSVLSSNGTAGRGAELRELASELILSVDVVKGSTADLTEGGVGGTVIINTRKPFDFKVPTVVGTLSGESSSLRGGTQPRASVFATKKFFDDRLGLMANVVYDNVLTRGDFARNTSWTFLRDWDFSPDKTTVSVDPAAAAVMTAAGCASLTGNSKANCDRQWFDYAPRISRYGIWTRDHKRTSAELTGQFKVSDALVAWASYEANMQDQKLNDRNFGTDFTLTTRLNNLGTGLAPVYNALAVPSGATCAGVPSTTTTPAGMVVTNHHVTQYTVGDCINVAGTGGQAAFGTSARDFALTVRSKYASAGFNYKKDRWEIDGQVNKSTANYGNDTNSVNLTQNAPGLIVNLDARGLPHFTFPVGYSPDSNNSYIAAGLQYRPTETDSSEDQLKLDFKYRLKMPFFTKVWFGAQGRKGAAKQYNSGGYLASNGADLVSTADDINVMAASVNQTVTYDPLYTGSVQRAPDVQTFINTNSSSKYINAAQMATLVAAVRGSSPGTFFKGYDGVSLPAGWMAPSYDLASTLFDTSHFNHDIVRSALGSDGKTYAQIPAFSVNETIKAAYLRLDYETSLFGFDINGNMGGRYAQTNDSAIGLLKLQTRTAAAVGSAAPTDRINSNSITRIDNSYNDFLPSLNVAVALTSKLTLRAGLSKVMSRPAIDQLVPTATCTIGSGLVLFGGDGTDDCTAGNPDLKPYRATNTDFSLEYFPNRDTQLSMALFGKDIKQTILTTKVYQPHVDFFHDGNFFDVTQPVNGRGAKTKGIELTAKTAFTFLPGYLSGLGADVNYTRMGYKYAANAAQINVLDGTELPFAGLSKNSYNLTLWYDKDAFNGRLAYNYRDKYFTGGNDVSGNPNFRDKTGYLDGKVQYRYNKNVTLSLEGKNLTDQAETTYSGDLFRVNELAWNGRRYFFSVSVKN